MGCSSNGGFRRCGVIWKRHVPSRPSRQSEIHAITRMECLRSFAKRSMFSVPLLDSRRSPGLVSVFDVSRFRLLLWQEYVQGIAEAQQAWES